LRKEDHGRLPRAVQCLLLFGVEHYGDLSHKRFKQRKSKPLAILPDMGQDTQVDDRKMTFLIHIYEEKKSAESSEKSMGLDYLVFGFLLCGFACF
jgi:hypothetical protein